jgi:hypothetical protein
VLPLWAQIVGVICSVIVAFNAVLAVIDRLTNSSWKEERDALFEAAKKEIWTEKSHFDEVGVMDTSADFSIHDKIGVQYPLKDVWKEAVKLRDFARSRVWSRAFIRYWWSSTKLARLTRKALDAIESENELAAFEAMRNASPLVNSIYAKLCKDVPSR